VTRIVLLTQHPSRGIERRREAVSRHKRGCDRIAISCLSPLRAFPVIFEIESAATELVKHANLGATSPIPDRARRSAAVALRYCMAFGRLAYFGVNTDVNQSDHHRRSL
jgi:hypothetical protein